MYRSISNYLYSKKSIKNVSPSHVLSWKIPVQSYQRKFETNVRYRSQAMTGFFISEENICHKRVNVQRVFKVNIKDTRGTSMTLSFVFFGNFESILFQW